MSNVGFYQTTSRNIPKDSHLHTSRREHLKYHTIWKLPLFESFLTVMRRQPEILFSSFRFDVMCTGLNTRIAQHKCNPKMRDISMSKTAEHLWVQDHRIQWNKTEITQRRKDNNQGTKSRYSLEEQKRPFISQPNLGVTSTWLPLVRHRKTV